MPAKLVLKGVVVAVVTLGALSCGTSAPVSPVFETAVPTATVRPTETPVPPETITPTPIIYFLVPTDTPRPRPDRTLSPVIVIPTPTPTRVPRPTPTPTPTPTLTPTATPTATPTPTPTSTLAPIPSAAPTPTEPLLVPTPTAQPTPTPEPTPNLKQVVNVSESIIARNTTWISSFQYAVDGDLQVAVGSVLTIQAGTMVTFTNATMFVFGILDARGTVDEPIVFTSDTAWRGIRFVNPINESVIVNGVIEKVTGTALEIRGLLSVSDSKVRLSTQGIWVRYNDTSIVGNEIYSNDIGVFNDRAISFDLTGNTIRNNVVGISVVGPLGSLTFNGNNIRDNVDANLVVTGMGDSMVDATNNWWGTADATLVEGTIRHKFDDESLALVVYEPIATEPILDVP